MTYVHYANFHIDPLAVGNFHGNLGRLIYNKFETGLRNERLNTTNGRQDRQKDKRTDRATEHTAEPGVEGLASVSAAL